MHLGKWEIRILSIAAFCVIWEIIGQNTNPMLFAPFSQAVWSIYELLARGQLQQSLIDTLVAYAIGLALSIAVGLSIGLLVGLSRRIEGALDPYITFFMVTPRTALFPIFMLWFGLGFTTRIVIVLTAATMPIIVNTCAGVKEVSGSYLEVAKAFGTSQAQLLRKIVFPAIIPFFAAGLRLGIGTALIGIIVGEQLLGTGGGLGGLVVLFGNLGRMDRLFSIILVLILIGISVIQGGRSVTRRLAPWSKEA